MFINSLSSVQQSAFLSIANQLVSIDGDVDKSERVLMRLYKSQMNVGVVEVECLFESLPLIFDDHKSKMVLIIELIGLACVDGDYDRDEKAFLLEVSGILDINNAKVVKCEEWVERQIALVDEANIIMGV